MTRLSCSNCGCASYVTNHSLEPGDIICDVCQHTVGYDDILPHLDAGERIAFDDDGYLCVTLTEHEHAYGYYEEN